MSPIINLPAKEVDQIIDKMRLSDYDFYLTGSRFFRTTNALSDYDFFVQDSTGVREFLRSIDFSPVGEGKYSHAEYADKQTVAVFIHSSGLIHVQIVESVTVKRMAQLILTLCPEKIDKYAQRDTNRAFYWNKAFKIAQKFLDDYT